VSQDLNNPPATEADLRLPPESNAHAPGWTPRWVPILIDGIHARAFVGNDGAWSEVIRIEVEGASPPEGMPLSFRTKHFHFPEPGRLAWGHNGQEHEVRLALNPTSGS